MILRNKKTGDSVDFYVDWICADSEKQIEEDIDLLFTEGR